MVAAAEKEIARILETLEEDLGLWVKGIAIPHVVGATERRCVRITLYDVTGLPKRNWEKPEG